ncbi:MULTISPECIES: ABC transporter ATP-binding protein [Parachlamydia]|jgi:ABC-2 type transport system ATP-binding protein|uniref:ATP-binding transport protein NatA n=2 Tax=Parachlamydia acanthamoebae TaxID=83552 RepID=F8L1A0_PARAV|nr:ATP-binding cassette domain-containing protein [Parachlamydia acanthamoebae]EFB40646.1 hypothetical protein pah_c197o021 [Parachlamydia acanthamoebae str. Hall's coccus]CCB87028.1 ATP-binding transport protein NatA [Parachlamydia acanthamoebae UV-7]
MHPIMKIDKLSKKFVVNQTFPHIWGTFKNLFSFQKKEIEAIHSLSFHIHEGEKVAFVGPNGAGKSTTIKMLTGILHPTAGQIDILGLTPWKDRQALGYKIGTVFGQRTQLWYHLPPSDTFALLAKIYEINSNVYRQRLAELVEVFEIESLLNRPVKQLSLGERMRCELVASLLHQPKILFLDEPTIGLDINAKQKIRGFLNKLSKNQGIALFLTSHDTADIEQVCDRVIVLDRGTIIHDSSVRDLKKTYMKKKILTFVTTEECLSLSLPGIKTLENANYHFICEVDLEAIPIDAVIREALKLASLKDVTIEDPSMEEVIRILYRNSSHA